VRLLAPVAERLDLPRPSYEHVRRVVARERRLHAERTRRRAERIGALLAGRVRV
jgi:hypothetical protein